IRDDQRYFSLPLVAMTAHAMVEERERCLAIGMNGHLSKPIEPDDLYATLARYFNGPLTPAAATPPSAAVPAGDYIALPDIPGLDIVGGLHRTNSNRKLYRQMLGMFANDYADYQGMLTHHLANAEWQEAERLAHTLKGLSGTLGANGVYLPAGELEAACKNRQADAAAAALANLTPLLTPLLTALQQHFAGEQGAAETVTVEVNGDQPTVKLPDCLLQLRQLLGEGDSTAIELWKSHHQEFSRALSPQVAQRIETALHNFEFDVAHALLDECAVKEPT
ncbi:MAG: Hpt domain-containing protein, partial [Gallionella sp.]|nr:Hpt domain-containing protein [Gallionella sp.]